jgi:superfamily II DNA helicase RecQ
MWNVLNESGKHLSCINEQRRESLKSTMIKCEEIRIMIASSAFGLEVDVPDVTFVMSYGCPADGLMYCQLAG